MKKNNYDIKSALRSLRPKAEWFLFGTEYSGLKWLDKTQTKPTEEEIVQKVAELEYQEEVNEYQRQRAVEYPPYVDYLDGIVKGDQEQIDAYIAACQSVKDKYPKSTMDPDELQSRKDKAIFDLQTERYIKATERLSQYVLLEGRPELTEEVVIETREVWNEETEEFETINVTENIVTQTDIEPLEEFVEVTEFNEETMEYTVVQVRNPLVVKDEEERAAAQAVIDATPISVIEAINT